MSAKSDKKDQALIKALSGGLVVSCQPVEGGPLDKVEHVVALALAAIAGGAKAVRIEGAENVRAVSALSTVPIIGIVKRDLHDSPIRITPFKADITALIDAGAAIIAFDATDRVRPVPAGELLKTIHDGDRMAMADCSSYCEGMAMAELGCEIIGSTMSGYVSADAVPDQPDIDLVRRWAAKGYNVMAEGRYNRPELAALAIAAGAFAVTVGSAITRIEHITMGFAQAIEKASNKLID